MRSLLTCGSGNGFTSQEVQCIRDSSSSIVDVANCWKYDANLDPGNRTALTGSAGYFAVVTQVCKLTPCQPGIFAYQVGAFGACSAPCKQSRTATNPTMTRDVKCMMVSDASGTFVASDPANCRASIGAMPDTTASCNPLACATSSYTYSPFGTCSASCGPGVQTRTVSCKDAVNGCYGDTSTTKSCSNGVCSTCDYNGGKGPCYKGTCSGAGVCKCDAGWTGTVCDQQVGCANKLAFPPKTPNGVCCPANTDVKLNSDGSTTCCPAGGKLDAKGNCCTGEIDECGICGGDGIAVSADGVCCAKPLTEDGSCCPTAVDACGVCGGDGSGCTLVVSRSVAIDDCADPLLITQPGTPCYNAIQKICADAAAALGKPVDCKFALSSSRRRLAALGAGTITFTVPATGSPSTTVAMIGSVPPPSGTTFLSGAQIAGSVPDCTDQVCAAGELAACPDSNACKVSSGTCVAPPPNRQPGAVCGGPLVGTCLAARSGLSGQPCTCNAGYTGDDCGSCMVGYVATPYAAWGASGMTCGPQATTVAAVISNPAPPVVAPVQTAPPPPHSSDNSLSGGAIAGIVIGCVVGALLIVGAAVFLFIRSQNQGTAYLVNAPIAEAGTSDEVGRADVASIHMRVPGQVQEEPH